MTRLTSIAAAGALAAVTALTVTLGAQRANSTDQTFLTFSHAVELPGVTLEPGTYEFRIADSPSRNVVRVYEKEGKEPVGQWTFTQSERPRATEETVVMFRETAEGSTPAIQYWYYPGDDLGREFIYPEDQAERIAARTGQSVLTENGRVTAEQARANADASAGGVDSPIHSPQANAQPSAPAGSTTGNRGVAQSPSSDVSAQASAEIGDAGDSEVSAQARADVSDPDRFGRNADFEASSPALAPDAAASADTRGSSDFNRTQQSASAPAQPSAPAGSTTGNRGIASRGDAGVSLERDDADLDAEPAQQAARQAPASAPVPSSQVARQDVAAGERPVGTSGQAEQDADAAARDELPRTASPLALSGLLGLLSLAGAAGIRRFFV